MKLKIIIHNAIRSVILGLLAALLCYYLWIKPNGGEYTFANYALDAVIYSVIFFVLGLFGEWSNIRAKKKEDNDNKTKH